MTSCRQVPTRSVPTNAGQRCTRHKQIVCTSRLQQHEGSRPGSTCKVSKDRDQLPMPVVDDADVVVLPPPPTGSQYAWRHSWRGSPFSSGGGNNGRSGRSQARTRDWGSGPHSSLLFVIMYRVRLLLLYGVWVTVLYGALHALTDLMKSVARCTAGMAIHAAKWANGLDCSNSNTCLGESVELTAAEGISSGGTAATSVGAGFAADDAAAGSAAATEGMSRDSSAAEYGSVVIAASANHAGSTAPATADQEESFAARVARAQDRPSAKPFTGLMSVIIPMYLMLMGSILFFASM